MEPATTPPPLPKTAPQPQSSASHRSSTGCLLVVARNKAQLTQDQLARLAGIHRGTIADLERGRRAGTRSQTLQRLAQALKISSSDLLADETVQGPPLTAGGQHG